MDYCEFIQVISLGLSAGRNCTTNTRWNYIPTITYLGAFKGLGNAEYAKRMKITQIAMFIRLRTLIQRGYVYKDNKRYYLTEKGLLVYTAVNDKLGPLFEMLGA